MIDLAQTESTEAKLKERLEQTRVRQLRELIFDHFARIYVYCRRTRRVNAFHYGQKLGQSGADWCLQSNVGPDSRLQAHKVGNGRMVTPAEIKALHPLTDPRAGNIRCGLYYSPDGGADAPGRLQPVQAMGWLAAAAIAVHTMTSASV